MHPVETFTIIEKETGLEKKCLFIVQIGFLTKENLVKLGYLWSSKKLHVDWFGAEFSISKDDREYKITMKKAIDNETDESKIFLEYYLGEDFQEASFIYFPLKFDSVESLAEHLARLLDTYIRIHSKIYKPLWFEKTEVTIKNNIGS